MGHHHHHKVDSKKYLFIVLILNIIITVAEIIGGLLSGSIALISDALHNFSDSISVVISYIAMKLGELPKNEKYTYGLKRVEILAAFINSSVLILVCLYLLKESYHRLVEPNVIDANIMIGVASIGLVANFISTLLLRHNKNSLNIRSTYLHLLSDTISSVGVILGGIMIGIYNIVWIDPLLTIGISLYILKEGWEIIKESINILIMKSPKDISVNVVKNDLEKMENIKNVHYIHIWQLNENNIFFDAHVVVENITVKESTNLIEKVKTQLQEKYNINHITIQVEYNSSDNENLESEKMIECPTNKEE